MKTVRRVYSLLTAFFLLTGAAQAQVSYAWAGAFPPLPALEHHAYRASAAELDASALLEKLWPGRGWTSGPLGDGISYELDASANPRGSFSEHLDVLDGTILYSWEYNESVPPQRNIGGRDVALKDAEVFLKGWLPAEMLAHPRPAYESFDEDGNPTDRYYELNWAQQIGPGVYAHAGGNPAGIRAYHYSHGTSTVVIWWKEFAPVDEGMEIPEYLSAERALASLNYVAGNVQSDHTSFDDPNDRLVAIDPMFSDAFDLEGPLTFCWAFSIQDARKGYVRTVLVDAATGDIYDGHDGLLKGLPG